MIGMGGLVALAGCTGGNSAEASGEVNTGSWDNYFEVNEGQTLRVEITEVETGHEVTVQLYNPTNEQVEEAELREAGEVSHQAQTSGEHRVVLASGGSASYEIYIETNSE